LLAGSRTLTEPEEHALAVECFGLLYEFVDHIDKGEEIAFVDKVGSWMIPDDEKRGTVLSLLEVCA
jgi:hypothetical protein